MPSKKSGNHAQASAWADFRTRRTEELKRDHPDQSGTDRQEQIREEWKVSDENPKAGK